MYTQMPKYTVYFDMSQIDVLRTTIKHHFFILNMHFFDIVKHVFPLLPNMFVIFSLLLLDQVLHFTVFVKHFEFLI